jgi:hypothetical protein
MPSWQNYECDLGALRAVDDGNADIARLPWLDRHPRVHLAVIEFDRAGIVDDQAGIERVGAGVLLHDRETAPDIVVDAGFFESRDFWSVERAHDSRVGVHRQAVQRVFGKHHEVHRRHVAARLADHRDDALRLLVEVFRRLDGRQRELHQPDDDAVRSFVQTAKCAHEDLRYFVMLNSPGTSRMAFFEPADAIMMKSVRM